MIRFERDVGSSALGVYELAFYTDGSCNSRKIRDAGNELLHLKFQAHDSMRSSHS